MSTVGATQRAAERNLKEAFAARVSRTTYAEVTPDSSFSRLVELWLDDPDLEGKVGLSRIAIPWPSAIALPPTASATAVCSPFGSPGT